MKRGYYKSSRSNSYQKRKSYRQNRSTSRSRDKHNKKHSKEFNSHNQSSRQNRESYRIGSLAKVQSDIKNHFRFKLQNLNFKQEEDTIAMLKSKLNQYIGPVQHITRSREAGILNLGFKYDIDALSFIETDGFTVKTSTNKIHLDPQPTKIFQTIIKQRHQQSIGEQKSSHQKKVSKSKNHKKTRSYSSSSSSKKSYRSDSRQKIKYLKLQIYGIPSQVTEEKAASVLSNAPGGPYKFVKSGWKKLEDSSCEYLEIRIQSQNADKMLQNSNKIQVDGRPLVVIEESQRPKKQLLNFQFQINFPKPVHPSKVLKHLQTQTRIVQIVANQQMQQDGRCKSYIITINDKSIVSQLKKIGKLSNGIQVDEPKNGQFVYRPIHLLPTRQQL